MASSSLLIPSVIVVAVFSIAGVFFFVNGVLTMTKVVTTGAAESGRWNRPGRRFLTALKTTLLHTTFRKRPVVRVAHWLVMVSFVALLATLITSFGQIFDPLYTLPLIHHAVWWGWVSEVFAWAGLAAIITLSVVRAVTQRRAAQDPRSSRFYGSTRWQAYFVEFVIGAVCASVIILHALQFALLTAEGSEASPASYPLTAWIGSAFSGASEVTLAGWILIFASFKICVSMAWMLVVGLDVAMGISWHRFLAPVNIAAARSPKGHKPMGALSLPLVDGNPSNNLEDAADKNPDLVIGLGNTRDLTWKDRLDVLTCTECGRCQDLCPAWNTDKPLSPKLLMLALRDNAVSATLATSMFQSGPDTQDVLGALTAAKITGPRGVAESNAPLVPDVTAADVLWDCTMCGACVEQCPVDIEHVDHIGNLRRFQFLMESAFPRELQRPMRSLETKGNPYNQMPRKRLDWAKNLEFDIPVVGEDLETAEDLDYLFWVGCAGAYDEKAKKTSAAVAELLHVAGVKFGVLGSAESCTGDPARRAGNEVLFQVLASAAIETLEEVHAQKIVVTCAHCFNTILNEFPQMGGTFEVIHHTQLLNRLLRDGLLRPVEAPAKERQTITYHDPCFLGRYNKVFEAPRELLGALPGVENIEMPESREVAMCCGAGGAHAWMEETRGKRIADVRMGQVQATGAHTVATACPFCTQMLESAPTPIQDPGDTGASSGAENDASSGVGTGIGTGSKEKRIEVKDVALLLLEGVRRGQQESHPHQ